MVQALRSIGGKALLGVSNIHSDCKEHTSFYKAHGHTGYAHIDGHFCFLKEPRSHTQDMQYHYPISVRDGCVQEPILSTTSGRLILLDTGTSNSVCHPEGSGVDLVMGWDVLRRVNHLVDYSSNSVHASHDLEELASMISCEF